MSILAHPNPSWELVVQVDALDVGVGATLSQRSEEDQKLHPYAFYSHRISPAKRNYNNGNKDLLAMFQELQEWRHWRGSTVHGLEQP